MEAKHNYDKQLLMNLNTINTIDSILKGPSIDFLLPLNITKIPRNVQKYMCSNYGFKSFNEVSLNKSGYKVII